MAQRAEGLRRVCIRVQRGYKEKTKTPGSGRLPARAGFRDTMGRIIAVMGATGNQGGSVARSLCQNPSFEVRAITRDPGSAASQRLAASGIQVVQADAFDRTQMLAAFEGCWGAFVNLNSDDKVWRRPGGPSEFEVSKMVLDAAAEAGVEHLVYSSGPPCVQMTGGRVRMNAMESAWQASGPGRAHAHGAQ